ncbi:tetratricopeptide repeat protein, partial [Hyalangium sp.]|uniref:tetratricopeptide repeat protein n=1 Tax=Hyalangium sp. TaxID=2028555 RepID=UPI002D5A1D26
ETILDSAAKQAYSENNRGAVFEVELRLTLIAEMCGQKEIARAHLDKAVQYADDNTSAIRSAFVAAQLGVLDVAESMLLRVPLQEMDDESLALLIDCAWHTDRNKSVERAQGYIAIRWPRKQLDEIPLIPFLRLAEALARAGEASGALEAVEARLSRSPNTFSLLVMQARLRSQAGAVDEAKKAASAALAAARDGSVLELFQLARLFMQLEMPRDSIRALEILGVTAASNERWLHMLAEALYRTNEPEAEQRISELAAARPESDFIQDVWIAVLARRGDIDSAIETCQKLVERKRSARDLLQLASLLARRDRILECARVLEEIRKGELRPSEQITFAGLLLRCERFEEALRVAASAALSDWANQKTVFQFTRVFLEASRHLDKKLERERVEEGCIVNVLVGQEERLVHFCAASHDLPRTEYVDITKPLGKAIYRKRQHDEIEWPSGNSVLRGVVTQVREEHVYLFQLAWDMLSSSTDSSPALIRRVKITPDQGEMLAMLHKRRERSEEAIEYLKKNVVPVYTSSKFLGTDFVGAWDGLQRIPDLGIRVTSGELSEVIENLKPVKTLLLDETSLLMLEKTDLLDLPKRCGFEIQVASQTFEFAIDALMKASQELQMVTGAMMVTRDGRLIMREADKEQQTAIRDSMDRIVGHLRISASNVAVPRSFDAEETERATSVFGEPAIASAIIAKAAGLSCAILIDDAVTAGYLREKYGVTCVGTTDLVRFAVVQGILAQTKAAGVLLPLVANGFRGARLPAAFFTDYSFSVQRNVDIYKRALRSVLLGYPTSVSALSVALEHLEGFIREAKVWAAIEPFVFACFDVVRDLFNIDVPERLVAAVNQRTIIRLPNHYRLEESESKWRATVLE